MCGRRAPSTMKHWNHIYIECIWWRDEIHFSWLFKDHVKLSDKKFLMFCGFIKCLNDKFYWHLKMEWYFNINDWEVMSCSRVRQVESDGSQNGSQDAVRSHRTAEASIIEIVVYNDQRADLVNEVVLRKYFSSLACRRGNERIFISRKIRWFGREDGRCW